MTRLPRILFLSLFLLLLVFPRSFDSGNCPEVNYALRERDRERERESRGIEASQRSKMISPNWNRHFARMRKKIIGGGGGGGGVEEDMNVMASWARASSLCDLINSAMSEGNAPTSLVASLRALLLVRKIRIKPCARVCKVWVSESDVKKWLLPWIYGILNGKYLHQSSYRCR